MLKNVVRPLAAQSNLRNAPRIARSMATEAKKNDDDDVSISKSN